MESTNFAKGMCENVSSIGERSAYKYEIPFQYAWKIVFPNFIKLTFAPSSSLGQYTKEDETQCMIARRRTHNIENPRHIYAE